jgi:1-deoxy-D-xylulose-5-phosphate synthase
MRIEGVRSPVDLGQSEVLRWGEDGALVCCGALLGNCLAAAETLQQEGLDVAVINARFVKPLDRETILRAIEQCGFVVTVEEAALMGGFGSAVLEAVAADGLDCSRVRCLGIPDRFIEHGEREELLADLGLDADGIAATCRTLAGLRAPAGERVAS